MVLAGDIARTVDGWIRARMADVGIDRVGAISANGPPSDSWLSWTAKDRAETRASALIAPMTFNATSLQQDLAVIHVRNPRLAMIKAIDAHFPPQPPACTSGENCRIHPTALVGPDGFGYEWDSEEQEYRPFPHCYGVALGYGVVLGAGSIVHRGTLRDTRVGDGARIGSGVTIGHSAIIGRRSRIATGARVGGSACVGPSAFIGMGSCIKNGVTIGEGATIGMGAVVLSDVPAGETWAGNPARRIK